MTPKDMEQIRGQFEAVAAGLRNDIQQRLVETDERLKRHFGVVAEGLRRDVQQVAEGVAGVREELGRFRSEVNDEFREVKAMIKFSYAELDRRLVTVETEMATVKARLDRIEARHS